MLQIRAFLASIHGLIILGLVAIIIGLSLMIWGLRIGPIGFDGLKEKLEDCRGDLESISAKRNEQKPITERRVIVAEQGRKQADRVAERIEAAPLPGQCQTPDAIMGADL